MAMSNNAEVQQSKVWVLVNHLQLRNRSWDTRAACSNMEADTFFDENMTAEAKLVCAKCPVATECLEWALATGEKGGVWGGMDERERQKERRRRLHLVRESE